MRNTNIHILFREKEPPEETLKTKQNKTHQRRRKIIMTWQMTVWSVLSNDPERESEIMIEAFIGYLQVGCVLGRVWKPDWSMARNGCEV